MNNILLNTTVTGKLNLNGTSSISNIIGSFKTNVIKVNLSKNNNALISSGLIPEITINNSKILLSLYNQTLFNTSIYGNASDTELFNIKSTNSGIVKTAYLPKASITYFGGIKISETGIYF